MDDIMKVSLINDALNMAISYKKPPKGLLWHTDFYTKDRQKEKYLSILSFIIIVKEVIVI